LPGTQRAIWPGTALAQSRHDHDRSLGIRQHRGDLPRAGPFRCTALCSARGEDMEYESAGVDRPQKAMTAAAVRTREHQNRGYRHSVARDEQLRSFLARQPRHHPARPGTLLDLQQLAMRDRPTQAFIQQASVAHLNTSCVAAIPAPTDLLPELAGPGGQRIRPAAGRRPSRPRHQGHAADRPPALARPRQRPQVGLGPLSHPPRLHRADPRGRPHRLQAPPRPSLPNRTVTRDCNPRS
jgi:hypothetical protein